MKMKARIKKCVIAIALAGFGPIALALDGAGEDIPFFNVTMQNSSGVPIPLTGWNYIDSKFCDATPNQLAPNSPTSAKLCAAAKSKPFGATLTYMFQPDNNPDDAVGCKFVMKCTRVILDPFPPLHYICFGLESSVYTIGNQQSSYKATCGAGEILNPAFIEHFKYVPGTVPFNIDITKSNQ